MIESIRKKVSAGERITRPEAMYLHTEADFLALGRLADGVRRRLHPENLVSFVVDRNVNYTNICTAECKFCAFYRNAAAPDAYLLADEKIFAKIEELVEQGGTQLLMQGGLNPKLRIEYFERLFRAIKKRFPMIQNHSLSPPEVCHIAAISGLTVREALSRLKDAGLDSLPGGGAELLVDGVRRQISPKKIGWREWAEVMREAAALSLKTTATMMFGSREQSADIIEHLFRIREMQAADGSFTAFIPWTFQPGNTRLGGEPATGVEYLRVLALSRIVLDNIDNIQASWVTQGAKIAQIALFFGANDMGGTMLEENVVASAGCSFRISREEIIHLVRDAGFRPVQRTTLYDIVATY